jgi:hypothetical protein
MFRSGDTYDFSKNSWLIFDRVALAFEHDGRMRTLANFIFGGGYQTYRKMATTRQPSAVSSPPVPVTAVF